MFAKTFLVGVEGWGAIGGRLYQSQVESMRKGLKMEQREFNKPDATLVAL